MKVRARSNVCVAKKTCQKHWGKPKAAKNAIPTEAEIEAEGARKRQEAQWARQREAEEQWRTVLRPRALQLIAEKTAKLPWSRGLIATLLEELNIDGAFTELVGRPQGLPTKRYPQAIAVALALHHSWRRDELVKFARRLGVKLTSRDLATLTPRTNLRRNWNQQRLTPASTIDPHIKTGLRAPSAESPFRVIKILYGTRTGVPSADQRTLRCR